MTLMSVIEFVESGPLAASLFSQRGFFEKIRDTLIEQSVHVGLIKHSF